MEKKSKGLIGLIILLIILFLIVLALVGYIILDKTNNKIVNETSTTTTKTTKKVIDNDVKNVIEKNDNNYKIVLKENGVKINEILNWTEQDNIGKIKYANIKISTVINNKETTIELNNLPSNALCANDNVSKDIIISSKKIKSFKYEGCYLNTIFSIFVFDDQYVGVYIGGEDYMQTISLYDYLGNEIYKNERVNNFDFNNYTFKSYEDNDSNYILNTYELVINEGKIDKKMIEKGVESYCDMTCGEGISCC